MRRLLPAWFLFVLLRLTLLAPAEEVQFSPENPPGMGVITNHDTPAYHAAKLFRRGVNLANYLEVPRGANWGVRVTADDFAIMKREGFDHVRVPIGWHHFAGPGPEFPLAPEIFARVDFVVTNALNNGLAVIINIHHFNELDRDPTHTAPEFLALWRQIAAHYRTFPAQLAFELDNEPHDQATAVVMNPLYARTIMAIRQSNPQRTLFVEPSRWGSIADLKELVLPPDENVIVSVHCYDPFHFTHQGASWVGKDFAQTGIIFPGPPPEPLKPNLTLPPKPWVLEWIRKYNTLPADQNPSSARAFAEKLNYAKAWSDYYGRPVHIGEFGAYTTADARSRANFYRAFREAAERDGLGWCIWDWCSGFRYWDKTQGQPMPGMRTALFGGAN